MSQVSELRPLSSLRSNQLAAAIRLETQPEIMLGMAMGCGKTITVLTAIRHLLDTFQVCHVLVIAPLLVAEETWPNEIEGWEHTEVMTYEVLTGPPDRREQRARRLPEISIINTENVDWLVQFWGDDWPYDMVVIDEISRFKNPATKTKPTKKAVQAAIDLALLNLFMGLNQKQIAQIMEAFAKDPDIDDAGDLPHGFKRKQVTDAIDKAMKRAKRNPTRFGYLRKVRKHIDRMVGLTGTLAPNGLLDIWSPYYLLDQGQRLGDTYHSYRSRYFESDYMGFKYNLRPGSFDQIVERIKDITISMRTEDYAELPPVVYNTIRVHLPEKVMKQYRAFEKTLLLEEHDIEAVNNGVLTGKLLQLCIAGGTEVLCARGWIPIEQVTSEDKVWDGLEFVPTKGVIYKGESPVVTCYGVSMTVGHKVLTEKGWLTAGDILYADANSGLDRAPVRLPDRDVPGRDCSEQSLHLEVPLRVRDGSNPPEHIFAQSEPRQAQVVRMPAWGDACGGMGDARHDWAAPLDDMDADAPALPRSPQQGLWELRRKGNRLSAGVVRFVQCILGGYAGRLFGRPDIGPSQQHEGLQQGELPLGKLQSSGSESQGERLHGYSVGPDYGCGGRGARRADLCDTMGQADSLQVDRGCAVPASIRETSVFDLVDCGPRNRFVVRGNSGPLIVHNCNGSVYDENGDPIEIHDLKLQALDSVIEEANGEPVLVAYSYDFDLQKLRKRYPQAEVVGEKPNLEKRWNNKEIPILLAHPQAAGHGLNLQYGGCVTVWYGLCWSLEYYQQLNKRLHRPGQAETCFIHHIVAHGTVDDRVMEVLPEKAATQDALVEATLFRGE